MLHVTLQKAPCYALDIFKARDHLAQTPPAFRGMLAALMAERHDGALIAPHNNAQPDGVPPLASFRLGRITGIGADVPAAIADWMDRATARGRG